ncbi:unnamed protein product [Diabrotica balteata]|uniref:Uncharacterized protein n=1 Tax=Diabrotica balteata TaxID=107213 RepID=A0A9N9SY33_DIABA|nr:unnamed protein product [Diabrotica balteata]
MDIPSTSGKSNNTFDNSDVSSIDETYADSASSYNPSDIEDSLSQKSKGENENVLVTDEKLQSSFQSNGIANPGEILRSRDIEAAKFSNLQDLLVYVPPYLHNFYNNLNVTNLDQRIQNNDDGEDNVFYAIEDSEQMME